MDYPYEAFTESCSFGLDEAGICVRVTAKAGAKPAMLAIAGRCLGAQYVASLDASVEGLLAQLPKPGTRLLFARTEADGRIVLVRSGPLERFMTREVEETPAPTAPNEEAPREEDAPTSDVLTVRMPEAEQVGMMLEQCATPHEGVDALLVAPTTKSYQEDETMPFARSPSSAQGVDELGAVTRRSPSTVRAFPAPPARLGTLPLVRTRMRRV
jgi:hypothetical protein